MTSLGPAGNTDPHRQLLFQAQLLNAIDQAIIATDLDGTVTYLRISRDGEHGFHRIVSTDFRGS